MNFCSAGIFPNHGIIMDKCCIVATIFGVSITRYHLSLLLILLVPFIPLFFSVFMTVLPLIIIYGSSFIFYVYKKRRKQYPDISEFDYYDGPRTFIAKIWDFYGRIWHGYDVVGMENIPETGPALLIFYHGAIPVDVFYLGSRVYLHNKRFIHPVVDRLATKMPGWSAMLETSDVVTDTIEDCSRILKQNNLLAIAPGGMYECQFSHDYELKWRNRTGFAKVALDAKVPIIPMYCQNIREAYITMSWGQFLGKWVYFKFKLPIMPVFGAFPVKLRTIVGKPIPYDGSLSPEALKVKVADALEDLISKHQKKPSRICRGLLQRFRRPDKVVTKK